jgi:hypothetical protein
MQCIYTYTPGTNHVPKEYRVADILVLLFMVLISLAPTVFHEFITRHSYVAQHVSDVSPPIIRSIQMK